jgi:hypothetical protein
MKKLVRIEKVTCLGERRLLIEFSDGLIRELEIHRGLSGVMGALDDEHLFSQVSVDLNIGTIVWPGNLDLDPDVLYGASESGSCSVYTLISESPLQTL